MEREFSAGGVCVRRMRGRDFVAAIRIKDGRVLALPKGNIDPGETGPEAAVREVREEAGVEGALVEKLGDVKYWYVRRDRTRVFKIVSFFLLGLPVGQRARPRSTRSIRPSGCPSRRPSGASSTRARNRWRPPR